MEFFSIILSLFEPTIHMAAPMTDIDARLEQIQPPEQLLIQLKPSPTLAVSDFLALKVPRRPRSPNAPQSHSEWFTRCVPNMDVPCSAHELILRAANSCTQLDSSLAKAVCDGMLSVRHPTWTNVSRSSRNRLLAY